MLENADIPPPAMTQPSLLGASRGLYQDQNHFTTTSQKFTSYIHRALVTPAKTNPSPKQTQDAESNKEQNRLCVQTC